MTELHDGGSKVIFPSSASVDKIVKVENMSKSVELPHDINDNEKCRDAGLNSDGDGEMRPPDGGWGWLVALGTFIISLLIPMIMPCFGVLFSHYLIEEGATSTTTAWIFSVQCFIWNIMALVTRPLIGELGWRKVGILSSVLTSIAFVISAFSPCPEFLFFSISLLSGIGAGIAVSLCFIILPLYFDRKRGVANSIMMAGICMGQIVGPPVARFLQDEYGFKGATLIIGALILNSCVGACFFHPVEWHLKKTRREAVSLPQEDEALLCEQNAKRNSAASNSQISCNESKGDQDLMPFAMLKKQRGGLHSAEASSISRNSSSLCISTIDIAGVGTIPVSELIEEPYPYVQDSNRSSSFCISKTFLRIVRGTAKDLTILRSPRVCILALNGTCFLNGYFNFMMIVPFAMQAAGRSLEDSAWCISISSICNLLLRVVVSSLSDFPRFNKRACYVSGFVVTSLTMFTFPLLVELRWQILTMAGFGCGIGATMGLYTITMIDVMGLDSLAPVFGATSFAVAFGFLCFGPMIGFIRDLTRSYAISMWAMGGTVLCSALSWFLMPAATRYDQRRADKQHQQPEKTNSKI